ncbi:hypothetical protein AAFP30_18110 [Gordonia sp. CPCC 205515]|uniref:LGFP repeat-containing protein n=1 Tax=Gordonia sp. CPCC 205515 TaxID=3140791 RepID=UPI003AF40A91
MTRRRVRARGLALGFIAAAGTALLMAPHASADPQSDATSAINQLAGQIQSGDADTGHNDSGLGQKEGTVTPVGDGFQQKYSGGTIYWSEDDGAKVLYGAIDAKYGDEGGPTGSLGFPSESEGPAEYKPSSRVASFAAQDDPKIYWTSADGAWVVRGPFTAATDKLGATLGAPTADMTTNGDVMTQEFANGTLTYNKATGAWTSAPDAALAAGLTGLAIPGMPNASMPNMSAPNMSANVSAPNMSAPNMSAPDMSAPAVSAPDADTGGFNWWWLIIPILLILAGLLLAWLLRRRKPTVSTPDANLRRPAAAAPTAPKPDLKMTAAGTAAAAAAGAAAAGAAMKARRDANVVPDADDKTAHYGEHSPDPSPEAYHTVSGGDTTNVVPDQDPNTPSGYGEHSPDPSPEAYHGAGGAAAGAGAAAAGAAAAASGGKGDGVGNYLKGGVETPVPVGGHLPLDDPSKAPEGYPIKGDANSGVYLTPDLDAYHTTTAEIWFATESAAEAAGFKRGS